MSGLNDDACLLRLASGAALFWHLNAVIDSISNDVIEWSLKPCQDVTVNGNVSANNIKANTLAKLTGHITNHARESGDALAERSHAATDHFVIQRRGYFFGATEEILKVKDSICQRCFGATNGIAGDSDTSRIATAHGCLQGFACAGQFSADGPECATQGRRSTAFNHGLAGELHHAVEVVSIDANGARFRRSHCSGGRRGGHVNGGNRALHHGIHASRCGGRRNNGAGVRGDWSCCDWSCGNGRCRRFHWRCGNRCCRSSGRCCRGGRRCRFGRCRRSGGECNGQRIDLAGVLRTPLRQVGFLLLGDALQQIGSFKQLVDASTSGPLLTLLNANQRIFHVVGNGYCGINANNARCSLDGMCRTHERHDDADVIRGAL